MPTPDQKWVSVAEACEIAGCTDGWVRHLLRSGKLEGCQVNDWVWLVDRKAAERLRGTLSSRSHAGRQRRSASPAPRRRKTG